MNRPLGVVILVALTATAAGQDGAARAPSESVLVAPGGVAVGQRHP